VTYYYLVASLPALALGSPPPLSPAQFRVLCAEHLEPSHLAELDLFLAGAGQSPFARRWRQIEVAIRNTVARGRAATRGLDGERCVVPGNDLDLGLRRAVQDAIAAADPKARERALDEIAWRELAQLAFLTPFALPAVLAYGLQLALCARWAARTQEAGRARLLAQVDTMLQHAGLQHFAAQEITR
jgi:hypothetical protein